MEYSQKAHIFGKASQLHIGFNRDTEIMVILISFHQFAMGGAQLLRCFQITEKVV